VKVYTIPSKRSDMAPQLLELPVKASQQELHTHYPGGRVISNPKPWELNPNIGGTCLRWQHGGGGGCALGLGAAPQQAAALPLDVQPPGEALRRLLRAAALHERQKGTVPCLQLPHRLNLHSQNRIWSVTITIDVRLVTLEACTSRSNSK
jgi:hypothetical protein